MTYTYQPKGTCSVLMTYEIEGNTINSISIERGCNGNLKGIASLLKGMDINEAITRLKGITCGSKPTSCPDQIAKGLEKYLAELNA